MRMYDLIVKKRNGGHLSKDEIEFMVAGFTKGDIPDYQMSAMMMAIYFVGMNQDETLHLTMAMAHSGDMLDLSEIQGIKVDKHSTGGVGDKTSLALAPMVAACGIRIAKMSGRGLGHTGGTIDKLESFQGFSTSITKEQFIHNVNTTGMSIMGQTSDIAPADKKLYALRDVTATVDNMSLIASSIMSKKLASGADAIILDVKTGSGAFMKDEKDARLLAEEMTKIGNGAGRKTMAVISDMDQPLGFAVGNALEVKEAIETLKGNGPEDFLELCLTLGSYMLMAGEKANTPQEARTMLETVLQSREALDKMADFVEAQGGSREWVYHPEHLPVAALSAELTSDFDGYVSGIDCAEVGICSLLLGGGRETKESIIDLSVGLILHKKKGAFVNKGDSIATIYGNDPDKIKAVSDRLRNAFHFSGQPVEIPPLIKSIIMGA